MQSPMSQLVCQEHAAKHRKAKMPPWHILPLRGKEKEDEGSDEIDEQTGAEQETQGGKHPASENRHQRRGNPALFGTEHFQTIT